MSGSTLPYSGIMTGYACSAECRHCMYCSSPSMPREFMTRDMAASICKSLSKFGVEAMHIGGGEPFLDFDSLCMTIEVMRRHAIEVEYIETNASWCTDERRIRERLGVLKKLGVNCLMVSVDPFHVEFVPLKKPLMLARELKAAGFDSFIWQEKFVKQLLALDAWHAHTHEELKLVLGEHYVEDAAREYRLSVNGRALRIAQLLYEKKSVGELLGSSENCNLLDGRHCHVDLYGHVVPCGCPGIAIELEDFLVGKLPSGKYPVASRLLTGGVGELYEYARGVGFEGNEEGYVTKCDLCYNVRAYLHDVRPSLDVGPDCFYEAMRRGPEEV